MVGVSFKLFQPTPQHVVVEIKSTRDLHNCNATIPDQVHCFELELTRLLLSFHLKPPVPPKHLDSVSTEPAAGQNDKQHIAR